MELKRRAFVAAGATALGGALAGCSGDDGDEDDADRTPTGTDGEPEPSVPLGIEHVRLTEEEPDDYREYEDVPDGTYAADEVVWIYYEPVGFETAA